MAEIKRAHILIRKKVINLGRMLSEREETKSGKRQTPAYVGRAAEKKNRLVQRIETITMQRLTLHGDFAV